VSGFCGFTFEERFNGLVWKLPVTNCAGENRKCWVVSWWGYPLCNIAQVLQSWQPDTAGGVSKYLNFMFNVQRIVHNGNNYRTRCNRKKVYLNLSNAQHVSGGISTHHQELITLYLQYLALMRPLLLATWHERDWAGTEFSSSCRYSVMSSWWWVKYHPKRVERFTDLNKLYSVAFCWIIIDVV